MRPKRSFTGKALALIGKSHSGKALFFDRLLRALRSWLSATKCAELVCVKAERNKEFNAVWFKQRLKNLLLKMLAAE
jgi:hypothetical protein